MLISLWIAHLMHFKTSGMLWIHTLTCFHLTWRNICINIGPCPDAQSQPALEERVTCRARLSGVTSISAVIQNHSWTGAAQRLFSFSSGNKKWIYFHFCSGVLHSCESMHCVMLAADWCWMGTFFFQGLNYACLMVIYPMCNPFLVFQSYIFHCLCILTINLIPQYLTSLESRLPVESCQCNLHWQKGGSSDSRTPSPCQWSVGVCFLWNQ